MKIRELENIQKDLQNAKMALIKQQEKVLDLQLEENKMLLDDAMKLSPKAKRIKTRIDEAFFDGWQNKDVVMWCKKTEYAKEFCRLMHEQGLKWCDGLHYTDNDYAGLPSHVRWFHARQQTCYVFNKGEIASKDYCSSNGYIILDFEDYIIKEEKEGMSKEELVKFLVDNFIDEDGDLDLSGLDFSEYDCDINIGHMKVSRDLYQNYQDVKLGLFQNNQKAGNILLQSEQEVGGSLFQGGQKVEGNLHQGHQTVQGDLYQGGQEVRGRLSEYY